MGDATVVDGDMDYNTDVVYLGSVKSSSSPTRSMEQRLSVED